MFMINVDVRTT